MADGYRRRALTAASTLISATCGSAGGMPCIPAARGGERAHGQAVVLASDEQYTDNRSI
uniref:Uncharacterized protein n=1 Tax=Oryza sativa subsp. japonica TaxID=39947 RepID=Q75HC0_ORYSJ|nr:hypothetical protein [Oryza sativa Japonica Group]